MDRGFAGGCARGCRSGSIGAGTFPTVACRSGKKFASAYALDPHLRERILRQMMDAAGKMMFFTANQRVRAWLLRKGATALEAADTIHSDMARGFIRSRGNDRSGFGPAGWGAASSGSAPGSS